MKIKSILSLMVIAGLGFAAPMTARAAEGVDPVKPQIQQKVQEIKDLRKQHHDQVVAAREAKKEERAAKKEELHAKHEANLEKRVNVKEEKVNNLKSKLDAVKAK